MKDNMNTFSYNVFIEHFHNQALNSLEVLSFNTAQKMKFSNKVSSVNVTKSAGNCGFGHIYWRNPYWKTSFFVQRKMLSTEIKMEIEALLSSGLTPSQAYNEFSRNLQSLRIYTILTMNWTFILKKLIEPSVQEEETLIRYVLNIARRNLEEEVVLKCSINLRK